MTNARARGGVELALDEFPNEMLWYREEIRIGRGRL
jgi:hypothetical protein